MPYSFSAGAKIFVIMLLAAVFYAPLVTLFISTSLAETEFSPRIDFFGLMYLYAAMFALTLKNAASAAPVAPAAAPCAITRPIPCAAVFCKNLAVLGAAAAAAIAVNCLFEAQKVWKLGFDAEMKLYRRAAARFMSSPDFSPGHRYIMVQGGSPAFRTRFYHTPYYYGSDDLLGISYVPGMNPSVMWNYYGVAEYADPSAYVYTFRPDPPPHFQPSPPCRCRRSRNRQCPSLARAAKHARPACRFSRRTKHNPAHSLSRRSFRPEKHLRAVKLPVKLSLFRPQKNAPLSRCAPFPFSCRFQLSAILFSELILPAVRFRSVRAAPGYPGSSAGSTCA